MAEEDYGIGFEAETCEHGNSVVWVTAFGERVAPMLMVSWAVLCKLRDALNKHHAETVAAGIPEAIKKTFEDEMTCRYCGSKASLGNKFYNVDCCVRCHKEGRE